MLVEFRCKVCGGLTERLLSRSEAEALQVTPCDDCSGPAVQLAIPTRIGAPILKGAGFYRPTPA